MGATAGAVEAVALAPAFWRGRRVFVTGHTGFTGSWLCLWLAALGAEVYGFSNGVPTQPSLYEDARIAGAVEGENGDICDLEAVMRATERARPEIVVHLAAQALVRRGLADPVGTFRTNVIGTAHVLESVRSADDCRAVVCVTSDKCYRPSTRVHREEDPLGGDDPYSASKAAAELVTGAYRNAFLAGRTAVASARAGNVIGGGDWAEDRLVPDLVRCALTGVPARIRYPDAKRPWQHVLGAVSGYLTLAERLYTDASLAGAWNFGPDELDSRPVRAVADRIAELWGDGLTWEVDPGPHPAESPLLLLDAHRARSLLGWRPAWTLDETLERSVEWYRAHAEGADVRDISAEQIEAYQRVSAGQRA